MSETALLACSVATAFLVALAGAWLLLRAGPNFVLDHPNRRSLHTEPVPRTGGLAVIAGAAAGAAWAPWTIPATVGVALLVLIAISFIDDVRYVPVAIRLAAHLLAGGAAAALLWPGEDVALLVVAALACAWTINAFNFMDGSDGMAGGMALAGFAAYGILAARAGDAGLAAACLSLAAASAAFLVFNAHPARIFLGDAGSVPLGYLAGALGIVGWARGLWSPFVPLVVFSPFLADATVTLARRSLARERIWRAHHDHYYQRLVRLGWGHRRTAFAAWATMLAAAAVAIATASEEPGVQLIWTSAWGALLCALLLAVEVHWRHHREER